MPRLVKLHPDAELELTAAVDWYEEMAPGLGADLLLAVDAELTALGISSAHAVLVPHVPEHIGARRVLLERFPYAVVFIEQPEAIVVLAFAHHRRRPGFWSDRS